MTSAITVTATQKAFSVYSVLSESSSLIRIITSMLLPFLSTTIIPTSLPIPASAAVSASTSTSALAPVSIPVPVVLPSNLPLNASGTATATATAAAAATTATADYYTVPKGTLMKAVVNINIDLESLPFTDASLNVTSSFSLSLYHQIFQDITGISLIENANYLMESFYYYYNIYNSYDITIEDQNQYQLQDQDMDDVCDDEEVGIIVDVHDKLNIPLQATDEDEIFADSYHEEINWFVELEGGRRTRLVSIMHVDLGSDIPHLIGELSVASNAIQSIILLQKVLQRDLSQQDVSMLKSFSDEDL